MNRELMWDCYNAIMSALERHEIDTKHDLPSARTNFYFKDCCGGTIVDEALAIYNWRHGR